MNYEITYFSAETKKVETKKFYSFEEAVKFGRENLENFNTDLIQSK